jgi:hypothetical protein
LISPHDRRISETLRTREIALADKQKRAFLAAYRRRPFTKVDRNPFALGGSPTFV